MCDQSLFNVRLIDGREFGPADIELIVRWATEGRIPPTAMLVPLSGGNAPAPIRVTDEPRIAAIFGAPPTTGGLTAPPQPTDDSVATLIPYRNKPALIGYYLAIFGCLFAILIPVLGFAMPIAAIVLGAKGLNLAKSDPRVHGKVHAVIAVVGGIIGVMFAMANFAMFMVMVFARR